MPGASAIAEIQVVMQPVRISELTASDRDKEILRLADRERLSGPYKTSTYADGFTSGLELMGLERVNPQALQMQGVGAQDVLRLHELIAAKARQDLGGGGSTNPVITPEDMAQARRIVLQAESNDAEDTVQVLGIFRKSIENGCQDNIVTLARTYAEIYPSLLGTTDDTCERIKQLANAAANKKSSLNALVQDFKEMAPNSIDDDVIKLLYMSLGYERSADLNPLFPEV